MEQDELMKVLQNGEQGQTAQTAENGAGAATAQTATTPEVPDNEGLTPRAKARIEELSRRNQELEKLVNMKQQIDGVQTEQERQAAYLQQQQQLLLAQQQMNNPQAQEMQQWAGWLGPKIAPLVLPEFQRRDQQIAILHDQVDRMNVAMQFPEYGKDPALQQEVENARRLIKQQYNMDLGRADVLTYLRGRNVDQIAKQKAEDMLKAQQEQEQAKQRGGVFVESGTPLVGSRPTDMPNKPLEDWTIDEMENFARKHPEFVKV